MKMIMRSNARIKSMCWSRNWILSNYGDFSMSTSNLVFSWWFWSRAWEFSLNTSLFSE